MPYKVASNVKGCPGFAVVKSDTDELVACHATKADAAKHVRALYANVPDAIQKATTESLLAFHGKLSKSDMNATMLASHHYITTELSRRGYDLSSEEFFEKEVIIDPEITLDGVELEELFSGEEELVEDIIGKWEDGDIDYFKIAFGLWGDGLEILVNPNKEDVDKVAESDTFTPPASVAANAKRALGWIREGQAGGGFTDVGRARAAQLAGRRPVSLRTVKRMRSFLARHTPDKKAEGFNRGEKGYPSGGRVAWDAWGGDAAESWARSIVERVDKSFDYLAPFMKADDKKFTLGPLYIPNKLDAHSEWTDEEELQKAVWDYVKSGDRDIHLQHNRDVVAGEWVEMMTFPYELKIPTTKADGKKTDFTYPANTVFMGVLWKDWAWELVKSGKLSGYSIGGKAKRLGTDIPDDAEKSDPGVGAVHVDTIMKPPKKLKDVEKSTESTLEEKAKEHNDEVGDAKGKRTTAGVLMQVYRRGIGAYKTNPSSVRPNVQSKEQWAFARVNGFLHALRNGRFKRGAYDTDLLPDAHPLSSKGKKSNE